MQENNFEKQMQQAMQEFRVTPSDNLWQQVKADLDAKRKSKRRWWFAAMIFCACLMLPSLLLNDLKTRNSNTAGNIKNENKNAAITVTPEVVPDKKIRQANNDKNDQRVVQKETSTTAAEKLSSTNKKTETKRTKELTSQKENSTSFVKKMLANKGPVVNSAGQVVANNLQKSKVNNGEVMEANEVRDSAGIASFDEYYKINAEPIELISLSNGIRKSTVQVQPIHLAMLEPVYKTTAGIRANKSKSINKGRFEIAAAAGKFSLSENSLLGAVFNGDPNKAYDVQSANVSGGVGIIDSVLYAKSYLQQGYSFSLAFNYIKPVSKKTSFTFGVGFRYGSTKLFSESYLTYAGPSNNLYSRAAGTVSVSNHFYFIDLPVQIQSLIGSGKKLPVYWNAGLQYSYLINSSTPQFNAIQNSYSISVLNKSIFGITAGIDVELFKNKKSAFKIGPSLYYSFSKAADKDFYKNMHYHFAGVRVKKTF